MKKTPEVGDWIIIAPLERIHPIYHNKKYKITGVGDTEVVLTGGVIHRLHPEDKIFTPFQYEAWKVINDE